jgi:hypothetical protein
MVPDAQGNQVPLILPVYRSTSTDPTPLIMAAAFLAGGYFLGPGATAGAAGSGATAGTAAAGTVLLRELEQLLWERQAYLPFILLRIRLSGSLR